MPRRPEAREQRQDDLNFFLLIYDRRIQQVVSLTRFSSAQRAEAEDARLREERKRLDERLDREIVLFQADSEAALRHTHGSYFLSLQELAERMAAGPPPR